jgi:hypothetical protein
MAGLALAGEPELSPLDPPADDPELVEPDEDSHSLLRFCAGPAAEERQQEAVKRQRLQRQMLKPWLTEALSDDLVLRKDQIGRVELKDATWLTNRRLTITTTRGKHHVLHFRRKHSGAFHALADAIRA